MSATVLVTAIATLPPAAAGHDVTPARVAGDDRVETAAEIARLTFDDGTTEAMLARARDFPDALAGAPLASEVGGPILLTDRAELREETVQALEDLGIETVTILGGPDAIAVSVEEELDEMGYVTPRVFGETRFGTAADIARLVNDANGGNANFPAGRRAAFIANGFRFPDALAASAPAAAGSLEIPILLVEDDAVPAATEEAIGDLDLELAIIVGGTDAVSDDVRQRLEDMGVNTDRVAGDDRVGTAVEIARFAQEYLGFDPETIILARGDDYPDALAAGPHAGINRDPILLTWDPTTLTETTAGYLAELCGAIDVIRAVGGEAAVTTATLGEAEASAETCHGDAGEDGQTYIVSPQQPREAAPGDDIVFSVGARYDGAEFAGPVDVTLFPCDDADVVGSEPTTFTDADDDGHADSLGTTETGAAGVVRINGEPTPDEPTHLHDMDPDEDGDLDVGLRADADDCAVIVFWDDADGDDAFDLDAEDTPAEPYGVGQVSWS